MGNTTSMKASHIKAPHAHQHGDVTCTMKHGKRRHHRTAKHKYSGHKHSGSKRRRDSGGSLMNPIIPHVKKHRRSRRKHSGGFVPPPHNGGIGVMTPGHH